MIATVCGNDPAVFEDVVFGQIPTYFPGVTMLTGLIKHYGVVRPLSDQMPAAAFLDCWLRQYRQNTGWWLIKDGAGVTTGA